MDKRMEETQQELKNCTLVKAILMLLVVWYHCILFFGGNWISIAPVYRSEVLRVVAAWLNSFHIYAFTLVSGYIYFDRKENRGGVQALFTFFIHESKTVVASVCSYFYFLGNSNRLFLIVV